LKLFFDLRAACTVHVLLCFLTLFLNYSAKPVGLGQSDARTTLGTRHEMSGPLIERKGWPRAVPDTERACVWSLAFGSGCVFFILVPIGSGRSTEWREKHGYRGLYGSLRSKQDQATEQIAQDRYQQRRTEEQSTHRKP
jgi:hypothetical protein